MRFDLSDLARLPILLGMSGHIAQPSNGIHCLPQISGQLWLCRLDLLYKLGLIVILPSEHQLQAAPRECSTRLRGNRQNTCSLGKLVAYLTIYTFGEKTGWQLAWMYQRAYAIDYLDYAHVLT